MQGLSEPFAVQDIFCSGIGAIEDMGNGCLRFHLYVAEDGEKIIVAKVVCSAHSMPTPMRLLLRAMGVPFIETTPIKDVSVN
jgi:hypothetical protein